MENSLSYLELTGKEIIFLGDTNCDLSDIEYTCIKIIPKVAQPFFVLIWYWPPSSTVDKFLEMENSLSYLELTGKEIIFLGDTNCDLSDRVHMKELHDSFGF